MKLSLKNLKVLEQASEETYCFEATLYANGKRCAIVTNAGHGGPDDHHPIDKALFAEVEAWVKTLPPRHCYGMDLAESLEMLVGDLITAELIRRDRKKAYAKGVAMVSADDHDNITWYAWPKGRKLTAADKQKLRAAWEPQVREKHPDAVFILADGSLEGEQS